MKGLKYLIAACLLIVTAPAIIAGPTVATSTAGASTRPQPAPTTPLFPWVPAGGYPGRFPYGQCTWWAPYNHRVTWNGKAWAVLFRSLYGIVRPCWKEWLLGQPWVAFELHCEDFAVTPRCWLAPELEGMLRTLLGGAVPGLQVTSIPDQIALPQPASRARLVPWRESLYPLSQPKADALRQVVRALSGVPHGVVKVVSPDMGHARETPHQQLHDCPEQHSVFPDVGHWAVAVGNLPIRGAQPSFTDHNRYRFQVFITDQTSSDIVSNQARASPHTRLSVLVDLRENRG